MILTTILLEYLFLLMEVIHKTSIFVITFHNSTRHDNKEVKIAQSYKLDHYWALMIKLGVSSYFVNLVRRLHE